MNTKLVFVMIAIVAAIGLVAAAPLGTSAYADGKNWQTGPCTNPGGGGGNTGAECAGGSEGSGPHDEPVTNGGGNQPPGQQQDD